MHQGDYDRITYGYTRQRLQCRFRKGSKRRYEYRMEVKKKPREWRGKLGALLLVFTITERVVGWGGSIDFLLSRSKDPDWVGAVLKFLVASWDSISSILMLLGVGLIVWNERRRYERMVRQAISDLATAQDGVLFESLSALPERIEKVETSAVESRSAQNKRITKLEKDFVELSQAVGWLVDRYRLETISEIEDDLKSFDYIVNNPSPIMTGSRMMGSRIHVINGLISLGYSGMQIAELSNKRRAFISVNAQLATVSDFEKKWWENGLQKQKWYLDNTEVHLFADMIDHRKKLLKQSSSRAFLQKFEQQKSKDNWAKTAENYGSEIELVRQMKIRRPDGL